MGEPGERLHLQTAGSFCQAAGDGAEISAICPNASLSTQESRIIKRLADNTKEQRELFQRERPGSAIWPRSLSLSMTPVELKLYTHLQRTPLLLLSIIHRSSTNVFFPWLERWNLQRQSGENLLNAQPGLWVQLLQPFNCFMLRMEKLADTAAWAEPLRTPQGSSSTNIYCGAVIIGATVLLPLVSSLHATWKRCGGVNDVSDCVGNKPISPQLRQSKINNGCAF